MAFELSLNPSQPGSLDREIIQHNGGFNENDSQRDPQFESILPNQQLQQITAPPINIGFGGATLGGSNSVSRSESQSIPGLITPDAGRTASNFGNLQGGIGLNQPQADAINKIQLTGDSIRTLLGGQGEGAKARINQKFDTASNNISGALTSRGFGGSSLNLPGQVAVESGRQSELGSLEDQLLGNVTDNESATSKGVSDLLFGSSKQATNLLGGILGSSGIGNFSDSSNASASASRSAPKSGGGAGGGSSTKAAVQSRNNIGSLPTLGEVLAQQQSGSGGGSSSGPQSQNNIQGNSAPQSLPNPHFDPNDNDSQKRWGSDKQTNDGVPLEEQELEPDSGPIQTPDAFARNAARLDSKQARSAAGAAPPPDASNSLAQSAAGTAGMINAGAGLA